jgi:hypothetical protein
VTRPKIVDVFEAQAIYRAAFTTILIFQRAAEKETATASLAQEIAARLQRARTSDRPSHAT